MAGSGLDEIWELLSIFDIPYIYDRYAVGVDFVLAFLFFLGVSQVTLGKRFTGKGGSLLTVAVSLLLSVGLSVAESRLRFSLASFGPMAIFFLLFIVGLVLYQLARHLGFHASTALSLAFVMIYFSIQAVSPSIMDFVHQRAPWLRTTLFFVFVFAAGKLLYSIFHTIFSKTSITSLASKIEANPEFTQQIDRDVEFEEQEIKSSKKQGKLSKKSRGDSEDILQRIVSILRILETEGVTPFARKKIADRLVSIADSEHQIEKRMKQLESSNADLKRSDAYHLTQLRDRMSTAHGKEKERLQREIELESETLRLHQAVETLGQRIAALMEEFKASLRSAAEVIGRSAYPLDARPYLQRAMQIDEEVRLELNSVQGLEKELGKLSKMKEDAMNSN